MKDFRIWHHTEFGIGFEPRKAKSKKILKKKLPKRLTQSLIKIEEHHKSHKKQTI